MKKWIVILLGVGLLLGLGIGAAFYLRGRAAQTITLSDGSRLTFLSATYGKRHAPPPAKGAQRQRGSSFTTATDTVCLWFNQEHAANTWPNYQALVYDLAETACVSSWGTQRTSNNRTQELVGITLEAYPRRDAKMIVRFMSWNPKDGQQEIAPGQFVIANPAPAAVLPKWSPESLPIAREDGDLKVTLKQLTADTSTFGYNRGANQNDPRSRAVKAVFHFEQNGAAVTNWQPVHIETTDATGNRTGNSSWSNQSDNDDQAMIYQWGLWPNEPAWKLRAEFSRITGFTDEEMWVVKDIPLEAGDPQKRYLRDPKAAAFAEATFGGIKAKLFSLKQFPPQYTGGPEAEFRIHLEPPPEGIRLTLLSVTDEQGQSLATRNQGWGGGDYNFGLLKLGEAKKVTATVAVHRSRFAEYLVKPAR